MTIPLPKRRSAMLVKFGSGVLALVSLASLSYCSTPPQADKEVPANYYPLKEGNKWYYRMAAGENTFQVITQLTKVENSSVKGMFRLEMSIDGKVLASEDLTVDKTGVLRHALNDTQIPTPVTVIRFPVKDGDTWEQTIAADGDEMKLKGKVIGEEAIEVPAGKFKALRVQIEASGDQSETLTVTYWFARNTGIVKQTLEVGDEQIVFELEKYELVR
jgi:hypothetical protein